MTITAVCSSCGRSFKAPEQFAGKRVKCKNCGVVFQIPALESSVSNQDTELDALEQLERTAGGTTVDPSASTHSKAKIGPKLERTIAANPDATEIPLDGPTDVKARANVMYFRYPGAKQVDQWLAIGLLLLGLVGLGTVVAGMKDTNDLAWISFSRYAVVILFYTAVIFPITLKTLKKAADQLRYRLPPNSSMRTFGIYMPSLALSACFWFAGNGSMLGLVLGLLFGLALSSGALWLLFRLRENELPVSIAYGAGGFLLGAGISMGLIVGLNTLTLMIVTKSKVQEKVPASPFSPGLAWVTRTKIAPIAKIPVPLPPLPDAASGNAPPGSPVVSELQTDKIPYPIDAVIRPASQTPVVGILHTVDNFAQVEAWNTSTMQKEPGSDLRVSLEEGQSAKNTEYQISTDGRRVAWIAQKPRLSMKVWTFDPGTADLIPLDRALGIPHLIAFTSPTNALIRWEPPIDINDTKPPAARKSYKFQIVKADSNANTSSPLLFDAGPMAPGPASWAMNATAQRLACASVENGNSILVQYDLHTGQVAMKTTIDEVDPSDPAGIAYSADGAHLAVLFEYPGGALLLDYDSKTGKKFHSSFVYNVWPPQGISVEPFKNRKENALAWLDSSNLVLYGQGIIDNKTGNVIATLAVPAVAAQRVLDENNIELLTGAAARITVAKLDREKLSALLNPPATAPAP